MSLANGVLFSDGSCGGHSDGFRIFRFDFYAGLEEFYCVLYLWRFIRVRIQNSVPWVGSGSNRMLMLNHFLIRWAKCNRMSLTFTCYLDSSKDFRSVLRK